MMLELYFGYLGNEDIENENSTIEDVKNQVSKLDLKKSKIELELNQVI